MLASVDPFLSRRRVAAKPGRPGYDCRHFAREVWLAHTGQDIADALPWLLDGKPTARAAGMDRLTRLPELTDPCLVLFRSTDRNHVGVFLRGRVLHLTESGVLYERLDLVSVMYSELRFYR